MRTYVIGSRGSRLALWQAEWLSDRLQEAGRATRLEIIHTSGDRFLDRSLASMGGKGVFVKEIEEALLQGSIDAAVHSLKDLPTSQPAGLMIACLPPREDPRDVLVAAGAPGLPGLKPSAIVGTGSPRRACQIRALRPDLVTRDLRGNLDTRLDKLRRGDYDAILLASAGLRRLGLKVEGTVLDPDQMLPAVGQGAMAVEIRAEDPDLLDLLGAHHHPPTAAAVTAERSFLRALGGGCQAPIAALGEIRDGRLVLQGLVADGEGHRHLKDRRVGDPSDPESVGRDLAQVLLSRGALELLEGSATLPPDGP